MTKVCETDVEDYLVKRVAACGGVAEKFSSPNRRNVPDRIVSWPPRLHQTMHGILRLAECVFVECKAPGEKPRTGQQRDHARRRAMGFRVYVVDTFDAVDQFIMAEGFK